MTNKDKLKLLLCDFEENIKHYYSIRELDLRAQKEDPDHNYPDLDQAYDRVQREKFEIKTKILELVN